MSKAISIFKLLIPTNVNLFVIFNVLTIVINCFSIIKSLILFNIMLVLSFTVDDIYIILNTFLSSTLKCLLTIFQVFIYSITMIRIQRGWVYYCI